MTKQLSKLGLDLESAKKRRSSPFVRAPPLLLGDLRAECCCLVVAECLSHWLVWNSASGFEVWCGFLKLLAGSGVGCCCCHM